MQRRPSERNVACACEPVLEAEVRHVVRGELARTVDDVARRTRLGLGACTRSRVVALGPVQARQEALTMAHVGASLGRQP
jgi:glycerol-3-phosphate dehydrogenase